MNPPAPDLPPDSAQRVLDIAEFLAKFVGSLAAVWIFLRRGGKPAIEWYRKRRIEVIREALKPELDCIAGLPARDERTDAKLDLSLERQSRIFDELDLLLVVVADGRERQDETNDLLDEVFATADRRQSTTRRQAAEAALAELQGRVISRRRREEELRSPGGAPS